MAKVKSLLASRGFLQSIERQPVNTNYKEVSEVLGAKTRETLNHFDNLIEKRRV
jgi:hypothetical protein